MFSSQLVLHPFEYFERNTQWCQKFPFKKKLVLKFARVDIVKVSFFFSVVPIWNSLPQNVIEHTSSDAFFNAEHMSQQTNIVLCQLHRLLRR